MGGMPKVLQASSGVFFTFKATLNGGWFRLC